MDEVFVNHFKALTPGCFFSYKKIEYPYVTYTDDEKSNRVVIETGTTPLELKYSELSHFFDQITIDNSKRQQEEQRTGISRIVDPSLTTEVTVVEDITPQIAQFMEIQNGNASYMTGEIKKMITKVTGDKGKEHFQQANVLKGLMDSYIGINNAHLKSINTVLAISKHKQQQKQLGNDNSSKSSGQQSAEGGDGKDK